MPPGLHNRLNRIQQSNFEGFEAETAKVATSANDKEDDVYVTLPNSDNPTTRVHVHWQVGVEFDESDNAIPRYPIRGDKGIVIYDDTGDAWLIW